jgi:protein O-GlcNAc transferase
VLNAVPDSRMVLGNVSDARLQDTLVARFAAHGIEGRRLLFHPRCSLHEYLGLHHEVDLVLDTFPYTGGITTQHSLWMGVSVLTLAGTRRAERISSANLARVGLSDWSVDSEDAFVARAVRATQELDALADLRAGLRQRIQSSPLRRPEVVARCFEEALRIMWRRWCEGLPPQAFGVDLPAGF